MMFSLGESKSEYVDEDVVGAVEVDDVDADRKSTRLNSSHWE